MEEITVKRLLIANGAIVLSLLGYIVTQNGTVFTGIVMLAVLLSPFGVAWYIINSGTAEIRRLREKIRDYRPSQWTVRDAGDGFKIPSKVRLGVFGVQGSGKSSFLNSLHFAFKGGWEQVYVEKDEASFGGETLFRDPAILSRYVTTFDTRGKVDLSDSRVPEVIAEITGKRGITTRSVTSGEKIDCPIFVMRYSAIIEIQHCKGFLQKLVPEVRKQLGGYPIMVVTFANSIYNREEILGDITRAGIEKGSVFFIENYTYINHEMDSKKHMALLKILEACIKRADDNITFRWRTENETPEESQCEIDPAVLIHILDRPRLYRPEKTSFHFRRPRRSSGSLQRVELTGPRVEPTVPRVELTGPAITLRLHNLHDSHICALHSTSLVTPKHADGPEILQSYRPATYASGPVIKTSAEILRLREKIRGYRPNQWTAKDAGEGFKTPSKARLGVFGVQDSGKSSFLNSLHFAFKGGWERVYVEKGEAMGGGGETIFRDPAKMGDYVTTFDTRGLVDLSVYRVPEVIAEITGKRGIDTRSKTTGEKIDCPIFILKYSSTTGIQHCKRFLGLLVPEVRKQLGGYPIMVVTFADSIAKREEILGNITSAGMEKGSVFFIENYTDENHEMDSKKHIALLKILEACIKRADDNITFRWRKEHETPEMWGCEIM